ncbi:MAG: serine/threonine protein kinase [Wenzhouxiangella sp.]|nr:serine/threonine protein kinase [Wenzhouxiangella sp.]MCH8476806.1 serine/threonine-protein kinase [Wenzhouxiangella sp.]TVR95017.1 MAG: serine/threonine protein kinase [Wenzhouxiangellaceae bacterium]
MSDKGRHPDEATRLDTLVDPELRSAKQLPGKTEVNLDLGRFQIIRPLGEGGMGQVYLARQIEPVERDVAVKVIRSRLNTPSNLARFEVERQALAQMNHPAIAQVFDAGTTEQGHPYFVMEYIDGRRLDAFCHEQQLDLRERLHLFVRICQGVQHAHGRGIVHRDIKPANILVRYVDGVATPKIIDFGIAMASDRGDEHKASRRDLAGTPRYMSPEQFQADRAIIDSRSDVYSLGVVLYELLVDQPPLDQGCYDSISQTGNFKSLTKRLPPPPPSSRLDINTAAAEAVAAARRTTVRRLQRRLKTDLDAVVLKALEPEPPERYESARALADDILRILERRPVSALPQTRRYRFSRFVQRHLIAVGSASAILLALIAGLTAATLGMLEAQRQFQIAEQRQQELEQVVRFQQSMLEGVDPQAMGIGLIDGLREQYQAGIERRPETATPLPELDLVVSQINGTELARRMLDQHLLSRARSSIEQDFAGQPAVQARLYTALYSVYEALGISKVLPELTEVLLERLSAAGESDPAVLVQARYWQALAWFDVGERERSLNALPTVVADAERLADDPDGLAELTRSSWGVSLVETGNTAEAIEQVQTALERARQRHGDRSSITTSVLGNLGYVHARSGDIPTASRFFREEVEAWRRLDEPDNLASALLNLGASLGAMGELEEALEVQNESLALLQQLYGLRHPISLRAMNNRAATLVQLDRTEEALPELEQTLRLRAETLGAAHPETLRSQLNLGGLMNRIERGEEALAIVEEVVVQRRLLLGDSHLDTLQAKEVMAGILMGLERHDESNDLISLVVSERRNQLGDDHRLVEAALNIQARNLLLSGQAEASLPIAEQLFLSATSNWPPGHHVRVDRAFNYYQHLLAVGQSEQAAGVRLEELNVLDAADPDNLRGPLKPIHDRLAALDKAASEPVQDDQ